MALNGLPRRIRQALRAAMSGRPPAAPADRRAPHEPDDAVVPAGGHDRSPEMQAALDGTRLSLAELQAALGGDFLTDRMLDGLVARSLDPAAVLRSARNEFGRAMRVRSFGPALGKWVLYPHPEGFRVWLKLGDSVSTAILRGAYDPAVTDIVRAFLKPGGTFLDVGANVGWYTLVAASFYSREGGRVLAFEPQADLFEHLAQSVSQNGFDGLATLYPHALGDREGAIQMMDGGLNSGGSYVLIDRARRADSEDARIARLDDLGPLPGRVDVIKIDIEGAEPLFFRGAKAFFETSRPPIVSEINVRKLRTVSQMSGTQYVREVLELGYAVSAILPDGTLAPFDWDRADEESLSVNVMFSPL